MSASLSLVVGDRIRDVEGNKGTIRYIGPVAAAKNQSEIWFGVEWDDVTRGKHDGSCVDSQGTFHRYFKCVMGAGSFIKSNKLMKMVSLVEALHQRYVAMDAPEITNADSSLPGAFVTTAKGNTKKIELLGEKKLRKWQQLHAIDKIAVRDENVNTVGDTLNEFASHLIEVDLQDNLLSSWNEVFLLGSQLPRLQSLLLHGNKLIPLTTSIASDLSRSSFSGLRLLALNACGINSWSSVQILEPFLPNIEELYLSENQLNDLPRKVEDLAGVAAMSLDDLPVPPKVAGATSSETATPPAAIDLANPDAPRERIVSGFVNLQVLDLTRCGLDEWSQVLEFRTLPALQQLILDGNNISSIDPVTDGTTFFQLHRMSLSSTQLSSWNDINALATFPSLRQLRLSHIPLFAGKGASEVRPLVIGRIATLAVFNASIVGPRERRDSEKSYLRDIFRAIKQENSSSSEAVTQSGITPAIAAANPRFAELCELYSSDLQSLQGVFSADSTSIASDLLSIGLRFMSVSALVGAGDGQPVTKRLPGSLTIGKLRSMIKQLFGLEPHLQQLSIRLYKDAVPTLLDDDEATLAYYGADNGSDIFINEAKK